MRRSDREVKDLDDIVGIMRKCDCCRLAMFDSGYPYIVPVNFGIEYDGTKLALTFHGSGEGKKMELIRQCARAAFEMDCSHRLVSGSTACSYTMEYESVCGSGDIVMLEGEEKEGALEALMRQYVPAVPILFEEQSVSAVTVYRLEVNQVLGKRLARG